MIPRAKLASTRSQFFSRPSLGSWLSRFFGPFSSCALGLQLFFAGCGQDGQSGQDEKGAEAPGSDQAGTAIFVPDASGLSGSVPHLKLIMVDVGQGDGLVLKMPSGIVVAIDGGPDRAGSYSGMLNGMARMDYILLSHAHADHYTGLGIAIDRLPPDCAARVFDPGYDRPGITGYQYVKSNAGCRYRAVGNGMSLALDPKVSLSIIGAADAPYPTTDGWGINNTSLVTYLRYGRFAALFTGDAQSDAEQRVYATQLSLHANVMKIGHHGSCNATGTSFLRAVSPAFALISAGQGNDFGHPHCQTLAKLRQQGSHFYRTDTNGTVVVETDGERYTVTPSRGSQDDPQCPRACASAVDF